MALKFLYLFLFDFRNHYLMLLFYAVHLAPPRFMAKHSALECFAKHSKNFQTNLNIPFIIKIQF